MNLNAISRMLLVSLCVSSLAACGSSTSNQQAASSGGPSVTTARHTPVAAARIDAAELQGAKPSHFCSLDSVNGEVPSTTFTADANHPASFRGWAVDASKASPPTMTLVLKGAASYGLPALTGQARPDVAKALGSAVAQSAGYRFIGNLEQVPAGTYQVAVWVKTSAGDTLCDTGRKIAVSH